jgi:hypothetical protein
MTHEQFEREMRYRTVMAVARSMRKQGLISGAEHDDFNRKMMAKHQPIFASLVCRIVVDKCCQLR